VLRHQNKSSRAVVISPCLTAHLLPTLRQRGADIPIS
jgi:hypothetical protein